jgi:hypothetical protein
MTTSVASMEGCKQTSRNARYQLACLDHAGGYGGQQRCRATQTNAQRFGKRPEKTLQLSVQSCEVWES